MTPQELGFWADRKCEGLDDRAREHVAALCCLGMLYGATGYTLRQARAEHDSTTARYMVDNDCQRCNGPGCEWIGEETFCEAWRTGDEERRRSSGTQ